MRYIWDEIALDVPDGWRVGEAGDVLEFTPPDDSGALHASVFERQGPETPTMTEAAELVAWFQHGRGGRGRIHTFADVHGVPSAQCEFTVITNGEPLSWVAVSKIWPDLAVLATYVHDPDVREHASAVNACLLSIHRSEET